MRMLPPPAFRPGRPRETSIETASAMAASNTSDPAAIEATTAIRGKPVEDEVAAATVFTVPVCAGSVIVPTDVADVAGGAACLACLRWCFTRCVFVAWDVCVTGDVVGVGADVVTGGGELVVGGGALV